MCGERTTLIGLVNCSLKAKLSEFLILLSYIHTYIHTVKGSIPCAACCSILTFSLSPPPSADRRFKT